MKSQGKKTSKNQKNPKNSCPNPNEPIRLNRFIAQSGTCSRREADTHILAGEVKVNSQVVRELGVKIIPSKDRVLFKNKRISAKQFVYILLNKPKNTITTTTDPMGRRTVLDLIKSATPERVYPVGRLDRNTTGLLLLTNDGDLAKRLTHPAHKVPKIYHARLNKDLTEEDMEQMLKGIQLDDGLAMVDKIDYVDEKDNNHIGLEIHIGKNRIVRRMFEALGYEVETLDRVMIAHLTKKNVPRGKWRILTNKEVAFLKMK